MTNLVIIGATSAIAQATARRYAKPGTAFFLMARNPNKLNQLMAELKEAGASTVACAIFDAHAYQDHPRLVQQAWDTLGRVDIVLLAQGALGEQAACEQDFSQTLDVLTVNALSVLSFLTVLANRMILQGHGTLAVLGSVAGDRGRQSNYVYGSAKAAVDIFAQGLRNRLQRHGVQVLTIKPGFVDTPMTTTFRKGILWSQPETIARGIERAITAKKDTIYLPGWWYWIMVVIKLIPEGIFKRLSL